MMGYGLLKGFPRLRKYIGLITDIIIFIFFVSAVVLYAWAFNTGFQSCAVWYRTNCLGCKEPNITGGVQTAIPKGTIP